MQIPTNKENKRVEKIKNREDIPQKSILKNFGPALLILALGIGSGEFILWPYLSAHYGFGILWGALLGISLQLFLIHIISRDTLILRQNIILSFSKVFSWAFLWVIVSTLFGFGWPGFASLGSDLLIKGFSWEHHLLVFLPMIFLFTAGLILILSQNAYRAILMLEKIMMFLLLLLSFFLFIYYFNAQYFVEMLGGFFGKGEGYWFIPHDIVLPVFLATFFGAVAYAGSGGNLLLGNSFFVMNEQKIQQNNNGACDVNKAERKDQKVIHQVRHIFKQNLIFFWLGGIIIIAMLSYISYVVLKGYENLAEDFSFLILEAEIFSNDIHSSIGKIFIILGTFAIFGVQLGILDFIGRIVKNAKNHVLFLKKYSDDVVYKSSVLLTVILGLSILFAGFDQPKSLIVLGAVINAFSMGAIALLLYFVEQKIIPSVYRKKSIAWTLILSAIFYFTFFGYVVWSKIFL